MNEIPKVIHYCWFGGANLSPLAVKCIESWKRYCPDYQIKRWDESNYDVEKNEYMYQAYQCRKWGFVPDFARLDIVSTYGGFYLDTDVELINTLECIRNNSCVIGQESLGTINLGLGFGAIRNHNLIESFIEDYSKLSFYQDKGLNLTPSPIIQTNKLQNLGWVAKETPSVFNDALILPPDTMNPMNLATGKIELTSHTISIHHFAGSWLSLTNKFNRKLYNFISRVFSLDAANRIRLFKHFFVRKK